MLPSGDNGKTNYDEVKGHEELLLEARCPKQRTYSSITKEVLMGESMDRAKDIFGVKSAVVVGTALSRETLYTAKRLIKAAGVLPRRSMTAMRPVQSGAIQRKAFCAKPCSSEPTFLDKIDITGDGQVSW